MADNLAIKEASPDFRTHCQPPCCMLFSNSYYTRNYCESNQYTVCPAESVEQSHWEWWPSALTGHQSFQKFYEVTGFWWGYVLSALTLEQMHFWSKLCLIGHGCSKDILQAFPLLGFFNILGLVSNYKSKQLKILNFQVKV